ncbi:tRNA lysidine(34) synthetase TilS [Acetobacter sp. DmW_043]|uniref:tRNA lysidine(34) synthetase TilS n=1 Tax=Acetobacter sp. DmW_043 TaxID=1670658 RepID=UPI000A39FDEC|nr:tRNA lysidine(34) synthetase TilS [Acetobacter sp. DmW_043]
MERLGPWVPDRAGMSPVALAVSGGGDSLCLAWLASLWRKNLLALIVDHGLRKDSAEEARLTARRLQALHIPSRIITLTHLSKGSGIAERARSARYVALRQACYEAGCTDLLLGHQADDQAETVAMRQRAGSGCDGLAGMASVTALPEVRLVRPLLGFSREALRQTLREQQIEWVDDPSNEDLTAERVRVRTAFRRDSTSRTAGWVQAAQQGSLRMVRETERIAALAQQSALLPYGWAIAGETLPQPENLSLLIRAVGGLIYPPSVAAVEQLYLRHCEATLAGVQLVRHKTQWFLIREAAAQQGPVALADRAVWDNRFRVSLPAGLDGGEITVAAAGFGLAREQRCGWPARFCATLPALWRSGQRIAVPHIGLCDDLALQNIRLIFAPPVPAGGRTVYDPVCPVSP